MRKIKNKAGQLKIQEMAFVLIAFMVFFSLVALLFLKFRISGIQASAEGSKEEVASRLALVLASTPELSWSECTGCIDLDKAIVLKNRTEYKQLWKLDYFAIKRLYPVKTVGECSLGKYPECDTLTLISGNDFGISSKAFVSLCRYDFIEDRKVCELGELYVSGGSLKNG
ncbi:MAG: hypothetical protein Q7R87_03210 [Nanoarchaeota archaeon]|nr:hypothetical protein [Nanoarchaeota archaeon]